MSMYYIPGALAKTSHNNYEESDYINSSDEFSFNGVNYPPGHLDRCHVDGAEKCTINPCDIDGTEYIISEKRNGPVISWVGLPRDPEEVVALKRTNERAVALAEIDRLEALETKRRIAEAMPDDAGGTAEGRAWLAANRSAISAIRDNLP